MDVLADFLNMVGAAPRFDRSLTGANAWTYDGPKIGNANSDARVRMYAIAEGDLLLSYQQRDLSLSRGDVVFLPDEISHRVESKRMETTVLSGAIEFKSGPIALATLSISSGMVLLGRDHLSSRELVTRFANEYRDARGGWESVSLGIIMSLFVETLRASEACTQSQRGGNGWLRGMADPEIGDALKLMHQHPEHRWTVAELAERLSISRSAFAERFKTITGRPPLEYLTWWRLQRAAARLRNGDEVTLTEVARISGYQSDAAFGKAFRREFGMSPGQVRRIAIAKKHTPSQLQLEIKKRRPFEVPEQEAGLNLIKTYEAMKQPFMSLMSHHGIVGVEYNILRILRGNETAISHDELLSHLLIPHDDIPKHIEVLVAKRYIISDQVSGLLSITKLGKALLAKLDEPVVYLHRRQLSHFSAGEIAELNRLLVKARNPVT